VDRAVPLWGTPEDGHAAETPVHHTLWSTIATFLAQHGVAPGASIAVADAALVTADKRAARGATLCIPRFPATSHAGGRLITAAVAQHTGEAVGVLAPTKPTQPRPVTS
jgi:hypothetical protein